ncbi:MAG TPA: cbb3-type cytochrome c oxidase subunit I [Chitinophagaceae bacterium]
MELFNSKQFSTAKLFLLSGILLLSAGMIFGLMGGLPYIIPGLMKEKLSFEKMRPLHVSSVVFWILFSAIGGVVTYLQQHTGKQLFSGLLLKLQLMLFGFTVIAIFISYFTGNFGGREYWEFPPVLAIPIAIGWLLFLVNFLRSVVSFRNQPVYVWMWTTGVISFLFTYLESYLWMFPYFRNNIVNDMTIQWKSYGSMVGSWNMLIYGCSLFLMDKISGSKHYSRSPIAFALYFLGLFNLMFNWGHHIYTLPTAPFIKHISYLVSMTELLILGRIIYKWRSSVSEIRRYYNQTAYRFLVAADVWIFLNLGLAIAMSVPAINVYTHGTHITVAHAMGTTIGINTFLLIAIAYDVLKESCRSFTPHEKLLNRGYWLANSSLLVFWISLIICGVLKARWQMSASQIPFSVMMQQLRPFFVAFVISGSLLMCGLMMIVYPLARIQLMCWFNGFPKTFFRFDLRYIKNQINPKRATESPAIK